MRDMDVLADIYLRLSDLRDSTAAGDDPAETFAAREKQLRAFADRLQWKVRQVVIENDVGDGKSKRLASAFKRRRVVLPDGSTALRVYRPKFRGILDDLAAGRINGLLAEDLDRTMRDPRDLEDLIDVAEAKKVNARSLAGSLTLTDGGTDAEITMARVMVAMGNKSSRDTSRRVRNDRERLAREGVPRPGRRAFGFEPDGRTLRRAESDRVRDAAERVIAGETLYGIVVDWNGAGVTTATGRPWTTSKVTQLLARPRNAGLVEHRGEVVARNAWEQIIPEDVYDDLMIVMRDPARRTNPGRAPQWLGSGIYRCWGCERPSLRVSGAAKRARTYRCDYAVPPIAGRHHVSRTAEPLDEFVETFLVERLSREDVVALLVPPSPTVDARALRAEGNSIRRRLKTQVEMHAVGDLTDDELRAGSVRGRARLAEIERELASVPTNSPFVDLLDVEDVERWWFGEGPDRVGGQPLERRRVVLRLAARVTVLPQSPGRRGLDLDTVKVESPPPR